jgi:hypothetical protein
MAYQLSPGVNVSEIDLTTIVPSVSTTAGAFAGYLPWGPAQKIITVPDEISLVKRFAPSGPDANSAVNFFTASSFLSYGNNLQFVRTVGTNCLNATGGSGGVQINNSDIFQYTYLTSGSGGAYGSFVARYPGALGNSIQVDVFDSANATLFSSASFTSGGVTRNWNAVVNAAPNTSSYVSAQGGANDEFHIVVTDAGGLITGTKGQVLETYAYLSKASDAEINGNSNYYKQVIFNNSTYIQAMDPVDYSNTHSTWGQVAANTTFARIQNSAYGNTTIAFAHGSDDIGTDANTINGYSLFTNKELVDISLVLTGGNDVTVQQYVIDNIVTTRTDCVAFVSPPQSAVVNQAGNEVTNINTWLGQLARSTSYAVVDSGWKYMYDKYNQTYRWIPLNGDIAGLCVFTDTIRDAWWSPAGLNRGNIKNAVKLAWNPAKTYRDQLYTQGVNPVVTFPGQGIVLFGDKTLQSKPSAFDRINVRRLFIVLEKAIAKAAQFSLFEFNDDFTRAQFVAMVTPFLRDIQGRRGITDFKVVCDTTNNTGQVIDSNQFVGDIYIKPARSINFIQLNFVAVGTGVDFTTVVGAV